MTTNSGDKSSTDPSDTPTDDELLAILRVRQAEIDPPPDGLVDKAMRALTWDTEFAALVAANPVEEAVLVRGADVAAAAVVDLVSEIDGSVLEVSVELNTAPAEAPGSYRVNGLVHPRCDHVRVVGPGGPQQRVECDSFGRFEATDVDGPFALAFKLPDGRLVRTELLDLP